jgi:tripartite-type tricarboxylate transporter receptor subunit TctC
MRRRQVLQFAGAAAAAVAPGARVFAAETFPSRPVEFIVPFPAGGTVDVLVRAMAPHLTDTWHQPIVVEDKPGGGTVIGTSLAAKAAADGHTVLFISNSFVINADVRSHLPYDGTHAFDPVAMIAVSPQVIVVPAESRFRTFGELIEAAHTKPGAVAMGSLGPATAQHIAIEMLQRVAHVTFVYVPFQGSNLAVNAVLGGHLDSAMANYAEVAAYVQAGKLRPLAVSTTRRIDELRDVPTVQECGYPGYEVVAWFGFVAPRGTPPTALTALADGIRSAVEEPDMRKRFDVLGLHAAFIPTREFGAYIAHQSDEYAKVIHEAGIRID